MMHTVIKALEGEKAVVFGFDLKNKTTFSSKRPPLFEVLQCQDLIAG